MAFEMAYVEWTPEKVTIEKVYPCRCGVTHSGDYAIETFNHHNCFHGPFWKMDKTPSPDGTEQIICSGCGEIFELESNGRKVV